jgi:AraC family transcriptional regulator
MTTLTEPRIEKRDSFLIAGLTQRFTPDTMSNIAGIWQRFVPHIGRVPGQAGKVTWGVISNFTDVEAFDYMAAVEISPYAGLPPNLDVIHIPALSYAVFPHAGHVSGLKETIDAIWHDWQPNYPRAMKLPRPGIPSLLERYGESFGHKTAVGEVEVWVPVVS